MIFQQLMQDFQHCSPSVLNKSRSLHAIELVLLPLQRMMFGTSICIEFIGYEEFFLAVFRLTSFVIYFHQFLQQQPQFK